MKHDAWFRCSDGCEGRWELTEIIYRCPSCDGLLEVKHDVLESMLSKGKAAGVDSRGVVDHHMMHSIYFRDPNGYVIELTAKTDIHDESMDPKTSKARAKLDRWQVEKMA